MGVDGAPRAASAWSDTGTVAATNDHYDVIVIGIGPGGGSLAQQLADTGKRILMLERGGFLSSLHPLSPSKGGVDFGDLLSMLLCPGGSRPGVVRDSGAALTSN